MEKTKHCDECARFNYDLMPGEPLCDKGHRPRWHGQKSDNPHDTDYGYKRRCDDFEKAGRVMENAKSNGVACVMCGNYTSNDGTPDGGCFDCRKYGVSIQRKVGADKTANA